MLDVERWLYGYLVSYGEIEQPDVEGDPGMRSEYWADIDGEAWAKGNSPRLAVHEAIKVYRKNQHPAAPASDAPDDRVAEIAGRYQALTHDTRAFSMDDLTQAAADIHDLLQLVSQQRERLAILEEAKSAGKELAKTLMSSDTARAGTEAYLRNYRERAELRQERNALSVKVGELQAEIARLEGERGERILDAASVQRSYAELIAERDALRKQVAALEQERDMTMVGFEDYAEMMSEDLATMTDKKQTFATLTKSLRDENKVLKQQVDTQREANLDQVQIIAALEKQVAAARAALSQIADLRVFWQDGAGGVTEHDVEHVAIAENALAALGEVGS